MTRHRESVPAYSISPTLLVPLFFQLLRYLVRGVKWLFVLGRLVLFSFFLLPAFIQIAYYYVTTRNVKTARYGNRARNSLDIFLPSAASSASSPRALHPVVVFFSGGAWTIGYKCWGAIFGRRLSENGVICVCVDYRNFPQASVGGMLEDVRDSCLWVQKNIASYGGDRTRMILVGQSAGAHLATLFTLLRARLTGSLALSPLTSTSTSDSSTAPASCPDLPTSSSVPIFPELFATSDTADDDDDDALSSITSISTSTLASSSTSNSSSNLFTALSTSTSSLSLCAKSDADGPVAGAGSGSGDACWCDAATSTSHVLDALPVFRALVAVGAPLEISSPFVSFMVGRGLPRGLVRAIFATDTDTDTVSTAAASTSTADLLPTDPTDARTIESASVKRAGAARCPRWCACSCGGGDQHHVDEDDKLWHVSPTCLVRLDPVLRRTRGAHLPSVYLLHGDADQSAPFQGSWDFAKSLVELTGIDDFGSPRLRVLLRRYANKSHTDPIIEGPIAGDDFLVCDILSIVRGEASECFLPMHSQSHDSLIESSQAAQKKSLISEPLIPTVLIGAARYFNPF